METRHIRLSHDEAISARKQLLSSELNLIHILKRARNYKILRKKETATKNKIKTALSTLRKKIDQLESTFPSEEIKEPKIRKKEKKPKTSAPEIKKKSDIQRQLDEIKEKLAKLN